MTERVKEIVRRGSWLYDGSVSAGVSIVRRNYFDGPKIVDEEPMPGYPPTDAEGCFYSVEYDVPRAGRGSGGEVYGCIEDAVRAAEAILKGPVIWQD
jgi:hypothetical protein